MRLRGSLLVVGMVLFSAAGAIALSCSVASTNAPSRVAHSELAPQHGGAQAPSPATPASNHEEPLPESVVDLEHFQPLLAAPELVAVRQAVFEEDYAGAAFSYEQSLAGAVAGGTLSAAQSYQLARLLELSGEQERASVEYENSARQVWELTEYARFRAGQSALTAGQADRALSLLEGLPEDWPFSDRVLLLRADANLALKRADRAMVSIERLLRAEPEAELWAQASLLAARVLLELAKSGEPGAGGKAAEANSAERLVRALDQVREVSARFAETKLASAATGLEQQILSKMPPKLFAQHQAPGRAQQLLQLGSLIEKYRWSDADLAAQQLSQMTSRRQRFDSIDCEARVHRAKALAGKREWGRSADFLGDVMRHCKAPDLHARALYLAGKYSAFDKRYSKAAGLFARLEREHPEHRLADDARLRRAHCYAELGDDSRFTQMLNTMARDYPDGDMVLDGVFELALKHMDRGDWSTVANVLDRAIEPALKSDRKRDHEYAGRERYYRARAWIETGEKERGLAEYEALIEERPLSYYMQHAYSRLYEHSAERAKQARERALQQTEHKPFSFAGAPAFESPNFKRALALTRVGDLSYAERELRELQGVNQAALLWSIALLYSRGGATAEAHKLARGQLTDWLGRWPAGDWAKAWQLAFPRPFRDLVDGAAQKNNLSDSLIYAVMREESAFEPTVVSPADAYGLMQLIRPTARHFAKKEGLPSSVSALKQPRINIALGARVLRSYTDRFPDNPILAIPAYNAGPGRAKRWLEERPNLDFDVWVELIPFRETRRYTKRVLASRGAYAFLYERAKGEWLLPERLRL